MSDEGCDLPKKLNNLSELIARSQKLKEAAAQMLKESAALDECIEKELKTSNRSAERIRREQ